MAEIVLGIGTSHSPVLALDGSEWHNRAAADYRNPALTLSDGRTMTYPELVEAVGEPYAADAVPERFIEIAARCQTNLDRLAATIAEVNPDIVVIVGDDQDELYSAGNIPAIGIYWGQDVVTHTYDHEIPSWMQPVAEGYGMDVTHVFPGHPKFAGELIEQLMDMAVDLAVADNVPDPEKAGFGHAFGFPVERLFGGKEIPMVPVMLNTYFPPNVMSAARAYDVGVLLGKAIAACPSDYRVAVLASGGLSHFVVDEELDRTVIDNLRERGSEALRSIPRAALRAGSSEILNWVMTAGAVGHLPLKWVEYEPIRRTPAGTGIGAAFAVWQA
jgi:hypothetical protein